VAANRKRDGGEQARSRHADAAIVAAPVFLEATAPEVERRAALATPAIGAAPVLVMDFLGRLVRVLHATVLSLGCPGVPALSSTPPRGVHYKEGTAATC